MVNKIVLLFITLLYIGINNVSAMEPGYPSGSCSMYYDQTSCQMNGCSWDYMMWSCQDGGGNCGNGVVDFMDGEQCDDWNTFDFDGCSSTCQTETRCGDGIKQTPNLAGVNEACDDGNNTNGDGCSSTCSIELKCGDGIVQNPNTFGVNEVCDDGNTINGDGCSSTCQTETRCGDGIKQTPNSSGINEVCDDGNNVDGDTCNATCTAVISNTCDFNYNTNALSCINNGVDFQNKKEIFKNGNDIYYQDLNNSNIYYKNSSTINILNGDEQQLQFSNGYFFYYKNSDYGIIYKKNIVDNTINSYNLSNINGGQYFTDGKWIVYKSPATWGGRSWFNKINTETSVITHDNINMTQGWAYDFNGLYSGIKFSRNHYSSGVSTWVTNLETGESLTLPVDGYSSQDVIGEDSNFIYFLHYDGYVYKVNKTGTLAYTKTNMINQGKIFMLGNKFITYQTSEFNSINSLIKIYNTNGNIITEGYHNLLYNNDILVGLKEKNNNIYLGVYTSSYFSYNGSSFNNSLREIIKINLETGEFVFSSIGPIGIHLNPSYSQANSDLDNENVFYFYRSIFTRKYVKITVNIWENTRSSGEVNGNYTHYILNKLSSSEGNMQFINNSAGSTSFSNYSQVKNNFLNNYNYMQNWYNSKGLTLDVINNNVKWNKGVIFTKEQVSGGILDGYKLSAHYQFKSYVETDNHDSSIFWRTNLENTSFQSDATWSGLGGIPVFPIENSNGETIAYLQFPCGNLICKDQYCSDVKKIVNPTILNPILETHIGVDPLNPTAPFCGDGVKNTMDEECDGNDGIRHDQSESCNAQCKVVVGGNTPGCPSYPGLGYKCDGTTPVPIFTINNTPTPPGGDNTPVENPINGGSGSKNITWTPSLPPPPSGVTDNDLYNDIVNFFPITDDIGLYKDLVCEVTQTGAKLSNKILVIDNTLEDKEFISKLKNKESFINTLTNNNDLANNVLEEKLKASRLNQKSSLYDLGTNGDISGIQFNLTKIPNSAIMRKLVDLAIDHSSTTMADYEQIVKNSCNGTTINTGSILVPAGFINTNDKGETILNLFRYNSSK